MSIDPRKVFVTGATGVVGMPAVRALVADGHQVTGVARTDAKADLLRSLGATPTRVDLFDGAAVAAATVGHDVIVNLATKIPPASKAWRAAAWVENERIRHDVSAHLADAAIAQGAERYVQEALAFAYADHGDSFITEEEPIEPPSGQNGVARAEANAGRVTEAGAVGVVLRFGNFYGPGSSYTEDTVRMARRRISTAIGPGDGYWSPIHADDAGSAVAAALRAPAGAYNVVDDEPLTRDQNDQALADAVGVASLRRPPKPVARLVEGRAPIMGRSIRASNARLKAATGWSPAYHSTREGWVAVVSAIENP